MEYLERKTTYKTSGLSVGIRRKEYLQNVRAVLEYLRQRKNRECEALKTQEWTVWLVENVDCSLVAIPLKELPGTGITLD